MKKMLFILFFINQYYITLSHDSIIINSIGIKFKKIIPGSFTMGAFHPTVSIVGFFSDQPELTQDTLFIRTKEEAKKSYDEGFRVSIEKEYYIGVYEVSQNEWFTVMRHNPAHFNEKYLGYNTLDMPIENISINDCKRFIKKLNQIDKGKYTYRIPTEIEWEYAARASNTDDLSWSEIWNTSVTGAQVPSKMGSKKPNAWGLYDMLGNVWEWTSDRYNEKLFADPVKSYRSKEHVIKGSCFYGDVKNATYMTHAGAEGKRYDIGLRLVMEKVK